ncbi:ribonuclease HII [Candidatus Auribacterota bacterium]
MVKKDRHETANALLKYERSAYVSGNNLIAGVDEAGRGSLAGPVVAGAVILPKIDDVKDHPSYYSEIRNSKKLTPKKREILYKSMIEDEAVHIGVGIIEKKIIDEINIGKASFRAMERAVSNLPVEPSLVLVDGYRIPGMNRAQIGIIDGDNLSLSVAAGSIVAKVVRDTIMVELDGAYPEYGFKNHKGYGTKVHLDMLSAHGPCPLHRESFEPVRENMRADPGSDNKRLGKLGEDMALNFLKKKGHNILDRNFTCRAGEIDIITSDSDTIVFAEVKLRKSGSFGLPEEAVDKNKQKKITDAANYYMFINNMENKDCRFDVISIQLNNKGVGEITHLEHVIE